MSAGTATCVGTIDGDAAVGGERTYRVKYLVQTTERNDQALTAIGAVGIPSIGQSYQVGNDYDNSAFVERYSARLVSEQDHGKLWEVLVTFSTVPSRRDDTRNPVTSYDYPWLAPSRVNGYGHKEEIRTDYEWINTAGSSEASNKQALASSAGEVYDDVYKEKSVMGLTIQKAFYVTQWNFESVRPYIDTLNDATFWGAPAYYYKLHAPSYDLLFTGAGLPYWDVRYEFESTAQGWIPDKHVDQGTYAKSTTTDKIVRFRDEFLQPHNGKGKLDGAGYGLGWAESQYRTEYYPDRPMQLYRKTNFSLLGIPTSVEELLSGK